MITCGCMVSSEAWDYFLEQAPGLSLWLQFQQHTDSQGPTELCGQTGNLQQHVTDTAEHSWVFHRGRPGSISTSLRAGVGTVYVRSVWVKGHIKVSVCKLAGIEMSCVKQIRDLYVLVFVLGQFIFSSLNSNSLFSSGSAYGSPGLPILKWNISIKIEILFGMCGCMMYVKNTILLSLKTTANIKSSVQILGH